MLQRFLYPLVAALLARFVFPSHTSIADLSQPGYVGIAILYIIGLVGVVSSMYAAGQLDASASTDAADAPAPDIVPVAENIVAAIRLLAFFASMVVGVRLAYWLPAVAAVLCGSLVAAVTLYWRTRMLELGLSRGDADRAGYRIAAQSGMNWGLPALLVCALVAFH